MAPLIPTATYRFGETTLPVCPTCSACGRHPASTTARLAPSAVPGPRASTRFSSRFQFSGPCIPRPPETTWLASATSSFPSSEASTGLTRVRTGSASTSSSSCSPRPWLSSGMKTLGRMLMRAGLSVNPTRA